MKKQFAADQAYERIRDAIYDGVYPSGERLTEVQMAEELQMSRTPVREALKRLGEEGLLKNKRVLAPTEKEFIDTFDVRRLLEGHAAARAAAYMTIPEKEELRACVTHAENGQLEERMYWNKQFHEKLVTASGNEVLIEAVSRMEAIVYLFRQTVVYEQRPGLLEEHHAICDAIDAGDRELADTRMKDHLDNDLQFALRMRK
ncbi:GntR family transcriptional regulator [Alkalicoccus chagannorensis]|uniref:GntR family transcriptional regulator n=1 Tax=Alkalicoccus chagannorensis TaxID=427072 RepID=UPI000425F815|nr:GntR family transcriptional regulator [Alkalicoccus chagannorensis]